MNSHTSPYNRPAISPGTSIGTIPSGFLEYGFYFYMVYTLLGVALGLWINNLASGLLVMLVVLCLAEIGSQAVSVIRLLSFPLGCGIVYSLIQLGLFDESLIEAVRPFLLWMLTLFLVQSLALRPNFIHRFFLAMSFIGLVGLSFLSIGAPPGTIQRVSLGKGVGFGTINEMAEWYGFCTVYFVVLGIIAKTNAVRILSWLIAVIFLYVMTLTVSRAALLGVAVATVLASRQLLKNGFLPMLLLACLGWIVVETGVFAEAIHYYSARGTEETGRFEVWPLIVESFLNSPWIGVGHSHVGAITARGEFITPHNGFLHVAQSSGIIPLLLFLGYWLRAGIAALKADPQRSPDATFYLPLVAFSFLTSNSGSLTFMQFPVIASLAFPMPASVQRSLLSEQVRGDRFETAT
jgi:O-antigen ligase